MIARASAGERRSSFGLSFQTLSGPLTAAFGKQGVVVTEVVAGGPADSADIRVGDVLLAVGDVKIDSAETATRTLSTANIGTPAMLRVRRAARTIDVEVTPAFAYAIAVLARASAGTPYGPEARLLFPAEVLESSRIPPSARVLAVNGRPVATRGQVQRELRRARNAVPVLLRQGNHQFFVAVEASR